VDAEEHNDGAVHLQLSKAEALVLFEWLHRTEHDGTALAPEQRVLWDMSAVLERVLVEPFDPDYGAIIDQARAEVIDWSDRKQTAAHRLLGWNDTAVVDDAATLLVLDRSVESMALLCEALGDRQGGDGFGSTGNDPVGVVSCVEVR